MRGGKGGLIRAAILARTITPAITDVEHPERPSLLDDLRVCAECGHCRCGGRYSLEGSQRARGDGMHDIHVGLPVEQSTPLGHRADIKVVDPARRNHAAAPRGIAHATVRWHPRLWQRRKRTTRRSFPRFEAAAGPADTHTIQAAVLVIAAPRRRRRRRRGAEYVQERHSPAALARS